MSAYSASWCLIALAGGLILAHAPLAAVFVLCAATAVALLGEDDAHRDARERNDRR